MTRGFGQRISLAVLGAVLVLGSFVFKPVIVSAEKMDCCIYTVMPASNPPQWLTDLKDASMWFEDVAVGGKCKKSSEVVILATKKIDKYYNNNDGDSVTGDCSQTAEYKSFVAASAKTSCCEITNDKGLLRSCTAIDKAAVAKSEIASGCILASFKQFLDVPGGDKLIAHKTECTAVASCTALQKKIDDTTSANAAGLAKVQGADKAAAEAAKIVAAGGRPPWTKQECEDVKQKNSTTEPAFIWIPPKNDPAAQLGNYCFIRQIPTNLQVNIGSNSIISGLPDYINVMYKYALGIGVIVMIIVIMFSGIQWMLSGIASSINDSKERIKNASLGLLLLFGANTILYTVNPQLLNLKLPPMQAIRPEKFDVPVTANLGTRCDPAEKDACSDKGVNFKCMPTGYYAGNKCLKQANGFMAIALGGAAIAVIGPFLIPAGGAASITSEGAGTLIRKVAVEAAEDQALNAVTGGETAAKDSAEAAAESVGGKKAQLIIGALAVATGLAVAADLYADAQEAKEPANGYCVELKPEKADFSVCQYDGECQSTKCLITSAGQCGAGHFGVCVSGQLRQSCLLPNKYTNALLEFASIGSGIGDATKVGNAELAKHYGCTQGSCVDNGRGAALNGIGVCSDGSNIGMACDSSVACDTKNKKLTCIKGFCRQAAYFSSSFGTNGLWTDASVDGPRCVMPTDCNDASITALEKFQGTTMVGCLKNPSKDLHLPARMLIAQMNGIIDKNFYQELSTYGRCVTDRSYWQKRVDKENASSPFTKVAAPCFINIYPDKGWYGPETAFKDGYLKDHNLGFVGKYATGFKVKRIGCGCSKAHDAQGYGSNQCNTTPGSCTVPIISVMNAATQYASENFISVEGTCEENPNKETLAVHSKLNIDYLYAGNSQDDDWNNGIRFPNIIDVQYTFAGEAQGASLDPTKN